MKKLKSVKLAAVFFVLMNSAYAGIPTFDAATFAQLTAQIQQMATQIQTTQNLLNNAQAQLEAITGNSNIGKLLYDSELTSYIPTSGNWEDIFDVDVSALAEKYDLVSEDPAMQKNYERELTAMIAAERSYKAQTQRLANIEALMDRANAVQNPQQREDLANAISIEQAAIQLEMNRMASLESSLTRDRALAERQAVKELQEMFKP